MRPVLILASVSLFFASPALTQSPLYTFDGNWPGDYFGYSVSGAGDVNGDGYADLIVGAYLALDTNDTGIARVFSGQNGAVLHTFSGNSPFDRFGYSVSGSGDVNNDGYADLIVGATGNDSNGNDSGSTQVFSGVNGNLLHAFNGDSANDYFGWSVSGAGDVNGDGSADFIVGAYGDDNNGNSSGSARVFSGIDGSILNTFDGDSVGDKLGYSVSGAGDVNGDGYSDLVVGAFHDDNNGSDSGSARSFSGMNGSILYTFFGDSVGDEFGCSVGGGGDMNGDGYADLIAGARFDDNNGINSGSTRAFSGIDGSVFYTLDGDSVGDEFGYSVSGAGDVNGDGYADLIVGAYLNDNISNASGSARVFSGKNGSVHNTYYGNSSNDYFGWAVSCAGDVNGDGYSDLIVGAHRNDNNGSDSGSARVLSGVNGIMLHSFDGDSAMDHFGWAVSGAGDVNNDGYADLIVGAHHDDNNGNDSGSARVFSGMNGSILHTFSGDSVGDEFGYSVSSAGDVNGDGYADLIVGAVLDDNNGSNSGSARAFSGIDGSTFYILDGDSLAAEFGSSVSDVGDVDKDGYDDFIVGAHLDNQSVIQSGSARVFSGVNGNTLYTFSGDSAADQFGWSVSGAGDVNGDSYLDFIVGAYADNNTNGIRTGRARVFSGINGGNLHTFEGNSSNGRFGWSVSGTGDMNGDGYPDLVVGAPLDGNNTGSARAFSGIDGSILNSFDGDSGSDHFGWSVSGVGDVNNDGNADFIVGAPLNDNNGSDSGSTRVLSGKLLPLTTDTHLMSISTASAQNLSIDAGVANALKNYWVFTNFVASGNNPGVTLVPGVVIQLNPDALTTFVIGLTQLGGGNPTFVGWQGILDANGRASASINTFGPVPVGVGESITHAALIYTLNGCGVGCDTFQMATNWVPMTTVP